MRLKPSLVTLAGLLTLIGSTSLFMPGTGHSQGGPPEQDVNVIRNADDPARQPFQRFLVIELGVGESNKTGSFAVPSGKRLVIEYATF